ncbi:esterase-like activity of phytase family protein [Microbulbifer sp. OS29]|uniref:Esterase-like activity of phytase family protein n=1 Tax=Microbulbifer okhotskensis TaxID=2926617 RepID=A0A9X2EKI5_9GAMM|nr:esterase-like activity of phytase family protein [Microbulbifer okhotskensis]MCO1333902.1 esterase-like activity of phytase family protein [Microbulbifer okhotskensis]
MNKIFLFCFAALLLSPVALAVELAPAKLMASYWVDHSEGLDISGLSFCNNQLLAVSDKNSEEIYLLKLDSDKAELVPYLQLADLGAPEQNPDSWWLAIVEWFRPDDALDFEGITCAGGSIYVVSEHYNRIIRIGQGGKAEWHQYLWSPAAKLQGYLQKPNASSEGLVAAGDEFWVAMEREPRGLLRLSAAGEAEVFPVPLVGGLDFRRDSKDVAGLDYHDGALFTLERNASAVCRRTLPSLEAEWCLTYRAIEESPEYVYQETRYGKGEGLAVSDAGIFVVLDNNNVGRDQSPEDRRALLLHLAMPADTDKLN